ncbi:hypothetical protein CBR_g48963 [Chara braunii]|uniref:Uncharacterized protein n=1 Tax=Chara braunii TaxID=69332 RepID=A0A388M3Z0_CHABU|nr:hypothetical protein CBR_g48963 [Chara braunii]|eukprot:GBG89256.1 hypothetical protein CBR_g48963 [Chara braunii]
MEDRNTGFRKEQVICEAELLDEKQRLQSVKELHEIGQNAEKAQLKNLRARTAQEPQTDSACSTPKSTVSKTQVEDSLCIHGSLKRKPDELEREIEASVTGKRKQQSVGLASALPTNMGMNGSENFKQSNTLHGDNRVLPNEETTSMKEDSSSWDKTAGPEGGEEDMDCSLTSGTCKKRDRATSNATQSSTEEGGKQADEDDEESEGELKEDDTKMEEEDKESLEYVQQYVKSLERARSVESKVRLAHHKHLRNLRAVTTMANDINTENKFEVLEKEGEINEFYAAQYSLKTKVENEKMKVNLSSYGQHFTWPKPYEEKNEGKRAKRQRNTASKSKAEEQTNQTTEDSETVDELNRQAAILEAQVNALRDQNRELDDNCLNLKDIVTWYNKEIEAAARLDALTNPKQRTVIPYRWNTTYETWEIAYHVVNSYLRVGKMEIPLLVVTNNLSENISESPVRDLGLTISLRMVRRGEAELSVVHLVEPSPESAGKARVTLGVEAMSAQEVKDVAEVSEVLLKDTTVDQDIVEVDENVLLQDVPEDVVHRPLKGSGSISEAEWHHRELVVAESRSERGLRLVGCSDVDLMVTATKINLRKEAVAC